MGHRSAYAWAVTQRFLPPSEKLPVAGVDGCRSGWLYAAWLPGADDILVGIEVTFAALLKRLPSATQWALDMPIGLPEKGPRACDQAARAYLGHPRGTSIFPAPVRASLAATSFEEAQRRHREADDGRSLTLQAFHLLPKIRELDAALRTSPSLRERCVETHPELCFAGLTGDPVIQAKRSAEGRAIRTAAIERCFPGALASAREQLEGRSGYARDDLLDAFAALWSAGRVARGEALRFPVRETPRDEEGLAMVIYA